MAKDYFRVTHRDAAPHWDVTADIVERPALLEKEKEKENEKEKEKEKRKRKEKRKERKREGGAGSRK